MDSALRRNPPQIVEGTAALLVELGYTEEEITRLVEENVFAGEL